MMKCLMSGVAALVLVTAPAVAQSQMQRPSDMPQTTGPSSGAGVPGHPGGKSGPAVKNPSETSGEGTGAASDHTRAQDSSKIPGAPGGKSGPATRSPGQMEK
jgi:hypothetical protein